MNVVGRQMSRSNSSAHHQRQYSDHFIDATSSNKWLQSSSLSQDFGYCGGVQGSRMGRSLGVDPSTPTGSRSSSLRKNGDDQVSTSEFSPGLLDLHSFDTELLSEMSVPSLYDGSQLHHTLHGTSFDDSEQFLSTDKLTNRSRGLPESNLLRSFSADKEKANNVAKIKVVVRKRPLNKKEMAKKEQDIITIEPNSNSLTVHETKLKVSTFWAI
ncbi:Kinesin-13A [Morella rubra]|uniref:Kinesin-13A n=1 Tax=Morella rubra TaxID=262757 RepID=A0A6A1ULB5_9ROSI|nr:Kinesin-13A [Morella rubra]